MWFSKLPWALDLDINSNKKFPEVFFRGKKTFSGQIKTSVASTLPPHSPSLLFLDDWSLQMLPHEFGVSACLFVSHNEKEVNLFLWKRTRKQTFTFSWNRYLGYLKTETWRFPSVLSFLMFPDISVPRYSESRTNATLNISYWRLILLPKTSSQTFAENSPHTSAKGRPIDWGKPI